jgi:hypothetical protein
MFPEDRDDVKATFQACTAWVDTHPRLGWYIAAISTLNVVLTTIHLFR